MANREDTKRIRKPVEFSAVAQHREGRWAKPGSYDFLAGLSQVPLADTELLLTSHHLPVVIDDVATEPRVVALTNARFQKAPIVSPTGEWLRGYMPIAIRCLPFRFRPRADGDEITVLEVATNLEPCGDETRPIFSAGDTLSREVQQIEALLRRLEAGKRALRAAAKALLMADVLAPFQLARVADGAAPPRQFFTVDRNRFAGLSPHRAALLCADSFLPVDLATACLFSQRLMATLIEFACEQAAASQTPAPPRDAFGAVEQLDIRADESELFCFDRFVAAGETANGRDRA